MSFEQALVVYISSLLVIIGMLAYGFSSSHCPRHFPKVVLTVNALPLLFFGHRLTQSFIAMQSNPDQGLGLIFYSIVALPFLACFAGSVHLLRRGRGSGNA